MLFSVIPHLHSVAYHNNLLFYTQNTGFGDRAPMKSIRYCLNKQLADICQRSVQLEELVEKIKHLLPTELAPYCKVSSFNKGCLILIASDAVWASQIRYAIPELRDKLRKEAGMYQLSSIKVSVLDHGNEYQKIKKSVSYELSQQTKEKIISESQHCTYEPLRRALIHLAEGES